MTGLAKIPESWLFVPCTERFLSKPEGQKYADNVIFDLEDSLKPPMKDEGLELLCSMIKTGGISKDRGAYVRLNKDRLEKELEALKDLDIDGFMLPKFEGIEDLERYSALIGKKKIVPLVETCRGIANVYKFANDGRICAIALGGEDFCSELGVETNDDALIMARSRIVLFAKAAGKTAIDTVSTQYRDPALFEKELEKSARFGFDGKLMIHPAQTEAAFKLKGDLPKEEMERIIKEFESRRDGAVMINGRLYERPHIERMKKILEGE